MDLVQRCVKYFQGNLGLFNSYPFTVKGMFKVKEAIKGTYCEGYDIYIIKYDGDGASRQVFQAACEGLKQESRYKSLQAKDGTLEMVDEKDTHILLMPFKNYIIIILGSPSFDNASKIAENLENLISSR